MNLCIFTGNLTADPELRQTNSGKDVASFKLAVNDNRDKAEFIPCTAWEKTASLVATYCHKGSKLMVQGRWNTNEYTDKDGNKRYSTQVMVDRVEFLTPKSQESGEHYVPPSTGDDQDIPF